jgi:hypothetical protein
MSVDSQLTLAIMAAIALMCLVPPLLIGWLVQRGVTAGYFPNFLPWVAMLVALLASAYVTLFVVFDDLGPSMMAQKSAPTIEFRLTSGYRGSVYVFFDPTRPVITPQPSGVIEINVPPSGKVIVGHFPGLEAQLSYATKVLHYPDGSDAPQVMLPSSGGSVGSVHHLRFFVGTPAEQGMDDSARTKAGTRYDEDAVYKSMTGRSASAVRP